MLLGLVMVTSASVSIASRETGQPFYYLERQLALVAVGARVRGAGLFRPRTGWLERASAPLLALALRCCCWCWCQGLGTRSTAAAAGCDVAGLNFQVSELARVLVLLYVASYAVRRESAAARAPSPGSSSRSRCSRSPQRCSWSSRTSAPPRCCSPRASPCCFVAGARLRYVLAMMALAGGGFALLALSSSYRVRRLTTFLDPWADPWHSGFQLTQSLIAIGRGQWLGVGLGESVQKLFYLPEAHTDFLFAVLAEELGLVGVALTLALFLGPWSGALSTSRGSPRTRASSSPPISPRASACGSASRPSSTSASTWACCRPRG